MFFVFVQVLASLGTIRAIASPGVVLVQTEAVCSNNFTWAQNSKGQSPCLVAAYIGGACGSDNYTVQALPNGDKYDPPTLTNPNNLPSVCTCSWAMYNLISACTVCQGQDSIQNWSFYDLYCTGFLTGPSYFPLNITLTNATSIPFWAIHDPTTWSNGDFDPSAAKQIAEEGHPDVNPSVPPPKSKKSIGPIVGGVVGGVAALVLAAGAIAYITTRKKRATRHKKGEIDGIEDDGTISTRPIIHGHSLSDASQKSFGGTLGHDFAGQFPHGFSPMRPGYHESSPSIQSLPYSSFISRSTPTGSPSPPLTAQIIGQQDIVEPYVGVHPSPGVPRKGAAPLTGMNYEATPDQGPMTNTMDREGLIEPFIGVQPTTNPVTRKGAVPVYDAPSTPPPAVRGDELHVETTPQRRRLNPPAYSPSSESPNSSPTGSPETGFQDQEQGGGTGLYRHRVARHDPGANSMDSQSSWNSADSGGSISALDGVIGHMGLGRLGEPNLSRARGTTMGTDEDTLHRGSTIYTTATRDIKAEQED